MNSHSGHCSFHWITFHLTLAALLSCTEPCRSADPNKLPAAVWIYKDVPGWDVKCVRSKTEKMYAPHGYMPRERVDQISVNDHHPIDPNNPKAGTCIKYSFKFVEKESDWQGVYTLVGGEAWGTKPGANIRDILQLADEARVVCRFRARGNVGGERVTFQCGGVSVGKHRSSLGFPVKFQPDPVKLTKEWQEFAIDFYARELTNVIDPFCVTSAAIENENKGTITLFVDDIRYEPKVAPK